MNKIRTSKKVLVRKVRFEIMNSYETRLFNWRFWPNCSN